MTTADDQPEPRRASILWPILSALAVIAGAAYAFTYGFAAIPPFIALFLAGALANVLHRMAEMLRSRFNNIVTAALSAVTLMVSMLSGVALIAFVIWVVVFASKSNALDEFIKADDMQAKIYLGFVLALYLLLGIFGLVQAVTLWFIVRANAFGPARDA
jgi:hypothetical protein